jgi:hypothetical protein
MATFNTVCVRIIIAAVVGYLGLIVLSPAPTASDRKKTGAVGKFISEKYGKFDSISVAYEKHIGKFYAPIPGRSYAKIIFYEIIEPQDIIAIEAFAKEALQVFDVEKIELVFYEKQNWNEYPNGGGWRGKENVVKKITVTP